MIFKLTLGFFSLSSRLFRYKIASLCCCVSVCVFFSLFLCVRSRRVFGNVNSVSSLDEPLRLLEEMLFIKKNSEGLINSELRSHHFCILIKN